MHFNRIFLIFFVSICSIAKVPCQLNIKIGYNGGFMKAPELNKIVDRFNDDFLVTYSGKTLDDRLDQFRSLHGLEVGLRYRLNRVGFEVSWNSISDKSDIFGTLTNNSNFQDKWYLSLTEFSTGIENYFGHFGYGASIGYRTGRIKTDITGAPRKKRTTTTESGFASKFYLIYQIGGDKVGLAFKPYVQVPLKNLDVSNFDQELNVQLSPTYQTVKPIEERFFMYGISIVLYNGKQE
jgi:hypothetical protein